MRIKELDDDIDVCWATCRTIVVIAAFLLLTAALLVMILVTHR